jgi:hypothetical protein
MNVLYIRETKTKRREEFLLEFFKLSFVALQCGGLVFLCWLFERNNEKLLVKGYLLNYLLVLAVGNRHEIEEIDISKFLLVF